MQSILEFLVNKPITEFLVNKPITEFLVNKPITTKAKTPIKLDKFLVYVWLNGKLTAFYEKKSYKEIINDYITTVGWRMLYSTPRRMTYMADAKDKHILDLVDKFEKDFSVESFKEFCLNNLNSNIKITYISDAYNSKYRYCTCNVANKELTFAAPEILYTTLKIL